MLAARHYALITDARGHRNVSSGQLNRHEHQSLPSKEARSWAETHDKSFEDRLTIGHQPVRYAGARKLGMPGVSRWARLIVRREQVRIESHVRADGGLYQGPADQVGGVP